MIKNTKRILALMLAVAVVAMSMFTGVVVSAVEEGTIDLLEFGDYLTEAGSTSKYYDSVVADNGETGDSWENAIIIDNAEEFVYLCKGAKDNATKGKYYKVADGIAGFDLSKGDIDINGTLAENIDKIKAGGKNHSGGADTAFQGHFDGNGVTVYGAHVNGAPVYVGLFSYTKGDVTIKNIHVNKAYFVATYAAGGIVGYHEATKTAAQAKTETESSGALVLPEVGSITIENCSVTDSYIETQGIGYGQGVGAILGYENNSWSDNNITYGLDYVDASQKIVVSGKECYDVDGNGANTYYNGAHAISNCYVNLDEANFVSKAEDGTTESGERVCHGGVVGVSGSNALQVSNCVVIGIKPYATSESTSNDVQHSGLESHFTNVYTTEDVAITDVHIGGTLTRQFTGKVFPLADAQLKGEAAMTNMNLDWSVWMADAEGYPELRSMHKDVTFVDNGDGKHSEICACGFGGLTAKHIWVDGNCACGAELNCAGRETIYWDGNTAEGIATGSGTKDNPYIINTADEFAWLIKQKVDVTAGKYYEIAENIGTIILQPKAFAEDILALESAGAVQAYFENKENAKAWPNIGWEQSCFAGIFDGNGATVYGLYQKSGNNAGLFSTIDAGAAIKNIALKNSYMVSQAPNADYQVGGLAAVTSSAGYGRQANGAIWFDSCVVANNYMYNPSVSHDRSGVIIGASSDMIYIDNCLVYGNNATYGSGVTMPVWSSGQNSQVVNPDTIIPEGLVVADDGAETPRYYNKIRNSVIMGAEPYDAAQGVGSRFNDPNCYENVYSDAAASTFFGARLTEDQIKLVTAGELPTLELNDAFLNTTTYPELAVFHDSGLVMTPNTNGTHGSVCSCGTEFVFSCSFVDGECSVCGAKMSCASKRTIYWGGTVATAFADTSAGTKDDPIIINSAEELAYLVTCKDDVTQGKYFEIAEDIGTIVLQPQFFAEQIMAIESAAEVKALFENEEYIFCTWPERGWEQARFMGDFNGNGVKIYGLYQYVDTNAGLFSTVEAGAAIRNVAVLNSYMVSRTKWNATKGQYDNYQVGAIAAVSSNGNSGASIADVKGLVWFDGCTVGNCYMRNKAAELGRSGVIFGAASTDSVAIDNCLVYGNDAKHGADQSVNMPLINNVLNSVVAPAVVPEGLVAKTGVDSVSGNELYYNTVRNTIAFGTDIMNTGVARGFRRNDPGCYENNFTDAAHGEVTFSDGAVWTYEEAQIKAVTLETLNENNLGDAWIKTDTYPELKSAHFVDIMDNGDGTHAVSCPCGAITGEAQEHTFSNGSCTVCGAECSHVAGDAVIENRNEPSCSGDGSYDTVVYCTVCGGEISRVQTTIPGGHTPKEAVMENIIDATCKEAGSYDLVVYCEVCDEEISRETITTEKLPHTPGDVVKENIVEGTCSKPGSYDEVTYCTACGEESSRVTIETEINPNNHDYVDDVCKDCSTPKPIVYGDVNNDGVVNSRDCVLLMQYINGWDVEIDESLADVNCDNKLGSKDYVLIVRYINEWPVILGPTD